MTYVLDSNEIRPDKRNMIYLTEHANYAIVRNARNEDREEIGE